MSIRPFLYGKQQYTATCGKGVKASNRIDDRLEGTYMQSQSWAFFSATVAECELFMDTLCNHSIPTKMQDSFLWSIGPAIQGISAQ